jgi:hypothetical protein
VEDSCEHGNEPSDSIKCWEVLELVKKQSAPQEGLSCTKLVIQCDGKTRRNFSDDLLRTKLITVPNLNNLKFWKWKYVYTKAC